MNLSLDEIITTGRQNFSGRGRGRGRGRGSRGRGQQSGVAVGRVEKSSYSPPKRFSNSNSDVWQHDLFQTTVSPVRQQIKAGLTKLHMENLLFSVTQEDLEELFGSLPGFTRVIMHYNKAGRSLGSAEIIFNNLENANRAMLKYNGVTLDGRPMKITTIGDTRQTSTLSIRDRLKDNFNQRPRGTGNAAAVRRGRGGARRGRGGNRRVDPSKEELDADLQKYRNETV